MTSSLYETLSISLDEDGVATLTLDRPGQLNTLDLRRHSSGTGKASELPRID